MLATDTDTLDVATKPSDGSPNWPADVPPANPNKLDTVRETADLFGCSVSTVWRMVANEKIPKPIKIGGMTRFFRKENLAVIEKAKRERTAA